MEETYRIHKLKTWPVFFEAVMNGSKTFELRKNDRHFKVGDRLDLMEYDPDAESYTGKHCHRYITYVLAENPFIDLKDNVIIGLQPEPIREITDSDIEKWAYNKAIEILGETNMTPIVQEMNQLAMSAAICGAKAYRDRLITGTGKSKDAIIQKQEELIELLRKNATLSVIGIEKRNKIESELEQLKNNAS